MNPKVKLNEILDAIEFNSYENHDLLHIPTGKVVSVLDEFMRKAEDDESIEHLPEWHQEQIELAIDILENEDNYVELPTEFDIHEYSIIEDFCYAVKDQGKQNTLLNAIRGKGAFRRFKDQTLP